MNMHLLVPRSKSSAKVKVKYKGYISSHSCFTNTSCFFCDALSPFFTDTKLICVWLIGCIGF